MCCGAKAALIIKTSESDVHILSNIFNFNSFQKNCESLEKIIKSMQKKSPLNLI